MVKKLSGLEKLTREYQCRNKIQRSLVAEIQRLTSQTDDEVVANIWDIARDVLEGLRKDDKAKDKWRVERTRVYPNTSVKLRIKVIGFLKENQTVQVTRRDAGRWFYGTDEIEDAHSRVIEATLLDGSLKPQTNV